MLQLLSQENNITLPISYPARETQGSGTTCQISEEIRENITNEILTIVQESFIPLIDETRFFTPECPCMSNGRRVAYLDMTNPTITAQMVGERSHLRGHVEDSIQYLVTQPFSQLRE